MKNVNTRIALKRDTSTNWTLNNPVILNGELILVDTAEGQLRAKIGDGAKTYTQLPFSDEVVRALITEVDNNNSAVVLTNEGIAQLLDTFNIVKLTNTEYQELVNSNLTDAETLYLTEDETEEDSTANQSDWNENDNGSAAYIKNRPFYQNGNTIIQLDEKFIPTTIAREEEVQTKVNDLATAMSMQFDSFSADYLSLSRGGIVQNTVAISKDTASTSTTTGALTVTGGVGVGGDVYANKVWGAVWNDYAEYREGNKHIQPGNVVCEKGDDTVTLCDEDCAAGCYIVSDTFGFSIGQTSKANLPVAVSGRVLAYTSEDRDVYCKNIGRPVCGTFNGKIRLMSDDEAKSVPWKILGIVSAVPEYESWGENDVQVNGRVWVKVR